MAATCGECGKPIGMFNKYSDLEGILICSEECHESYWTEEKKKARTDRIGEEVINRVSIAEELRKQYQEKYDAIASVNVSTLQKLPGNVPFEVIDVVTSECVYGVNIFRDFLTNITDLTGGRSGSAERVLKDLRTTCLFELRSEAHRLNADAVLGVNLDYSEFSGGGKSMLFLVASGTAVKIVETKEQ